MTVVAQIDGRVEQIGTSEGASVAEGGVLVQLINAAVERDAEVTRAQLEMIDRRLRGSSPRGPVAAARPTDSLAISEKILELKRRRFDKMKSLRGTNDVTARDLEQAEVEYLAALRDYNNERRSMAGGSAAAVTADPELLRIERQKTMAEQRFAAHRQSLLRVVSPMTGVVTRLHVTPGQPVYPRDPIADITNISTLHVRGEVAPELLRYIRPGTRVDVKILSVPSRTFADEVDYVIPVQGSGGETRAAAVVVSIPNPDGALQPNTEALITLRPAR